MKNRIFLTLTIIALLISSVFCIGIFASETDKKESKGKIQVWLIAGQSNALGYGAELPDAAAVDERFENGFDNVIAYGRLAAKDVTDETVFEKVKFGMGKSASDAGAEIGIASALGNSGEMHAVIKYAVGATKLYPSNESTWTSPSYISAVNGDDTAANDIPSSYANVGKHYNTFIETVEKGLKLLIEEGYTPVIRGLLWMQGEAETTTNADLASEYEKLLTYLIDDMRRDLARISGDASLNGDNPMPFVIGRINRNLALTGEAQLANVAKVNLAQTAVSEKKDNIYLLDARNAYGFYQYDAWHYNTETQMYLGEQFVASVLKAENKYLVYADGKYASINTGMYSVGESVTVDFTIHEDREIISVTIETEGSEPREITLTDGKYVIDSMPEENVRFMINTSASGACDTVTKYGTIPEQYFYSGEYPFAVFKDGKFIEACGTFTDGAVRIAAEAGDGAVILLRRDFDMITEANGRSHLSELNGSIIIDLGENTISMGGESGNFDGMIKCEAHRLGYTTNVTLINGKILFGSDPVVRVSGANDESRTSAEYIAGYAENPQKFNVTFDGITFGIDESCTKFGYSMIYSYHNFSGKNYTNLSLTTLTAKNCTFDFRKATSDMTVFKYGNIAFNVNLIGGAILTNDTAAITLTASTSITATAADDGKYTTLTTPSGSEVPSASIKNSDGNKLSFILTSEGAETNNYELGIEEGGVSTKYGIIPKEFSDAEEYPFAIFKKDSSSPTGWSFEEAGNTLCNGNNASVIKSAVLLSKTKVEVTVLMRSNYTRSTAEYSGLYAALAPITIDLGGFTLTDAYTKTITAFLYVSQKANNNNTVTMKNGSFVIAGKAPLVSYYASVDGADAPFKVVLENLNIKVASSATSSNVIAGRAASHTLASAKITVEVNNCNIDLRESVNTITVYNSLDSGEKGAYNVVSVKVNGGSIIADTLDNVTFTKFRNNGSSVTFGKSENGKYLTITLPAGVNPPTDKINTGDLVFSRAGSSDDGIIYTFMPKSATDLGFKPKTSITLGAELVYNVYIPAVPNLKSFTINGEAVEISDTVTLEDGNEYYQIAIPLPSAEAIKDIVLVATLNTDSKDYTGSFTMNLLKYASAVIANDTSEETVKLVKNVLVYIKSAYVYFNNSNADEVITKIDKIVGSYSESAKEISGETSHAPGINAVTLVLGAKPSIRFFGEASANYTYKCGSAVLSSVYNETEKYTDVYLYAYQVVGTITYTDGEASGSYHVSSYIDFANNKYEGADKEQLCELTDKFIAYCVFAKTYRDANS